MEILMAMLMAFVVTGCGMISETKTLPLETDTFISSDDAANHSELGYLQVSRSAEREDRIITRFPTTDKDAQDSLSDAFERGIAAIFFMPVIIIGDILSCDSAVLQPQNLVKADLVFEIDDDQEGSLDGKLELASLTKPWWHTVSWSRAHPFSMSGNWSAPGGDVDPSFTPLVNTVDSGLVRFDVTQYFRSAISSGGVTHYGFVVRSKAASLNPVKFRSKQSGSGPRVVATYKGYCGQKGSGIWRSTYYLGSEPINH